MSDTSRIRHLPGLCAYPRRGGNPAVTLDEFMRTGPRLQCKVCKREYLYLCVAVAKQYKGEQP